MADGVLLSEDAARRMADATRWVEGHRGVTVPKHGWYPFSPDDSTSGGLAVSKTTAAWTLGTSQELTIYDGAPPAEAEPTSDPRKVTAWNRLADVKSGRWVVIGLAHTDPDGKEVWYLLATECAKVEVVTDIQCVAGKMQVTKSFIWAIPYEP